MNLNYTQQLQRLNEYQKAAVFDESSACLVNANVGSGKTTVLITKVMYLHYEKQIPYEQMVVLTFTNKAADEIKERLYALEPEIKEEQLWGIYRVSKCQNRMSYSTGICPVVPDN